MSDELDKYPHILHDSKKAILVFYSVKSLAHLFSLPKIIKYLFDTIALTTLDLDSMFKNTFQSGFLSILYSIGSKPLQIWDKKVRNGHIKRITDPDIQSFVLEIVGTNVSTTYITCPADPRKTLGIKLPYLVMIVKNMKKYFTFEVQVKLKHDRAENFKNSRPKIS